MTWYVWAFIALACLIGELLTTGLYLAWLAVAAAIVAPVALAAPTPVQIVLFAVLSLILIIAARPFAVGYLKRATPEESVPRVGPSDQFGTAVGAIDHRQGQIQVGSGEFWSARTLDPSVTIPAGREVEIVRMDGLIARVQPTTPALDVPDIDGDVPFGLSARELEVLNLVAQGLSNQEIADRLYLSPRTVHHHVSHILTKMNVDNRTEAVRLAMDRGLIERQA
jgi:DNA-binding CsgD family transcriptional regulator/membrane protein implicated in regulation of membrane protease activity